MEPKYVKATGLLAAVMRRFRAAAFTVYPRIYVRAEFWPLPPALQAHELVHWREQQLARVPWLLAYLLLRPFYGGGVQHPMEVWAYEAGERATAGAKPAEGFCE